MRIGIAIAVLISVVAVGAIFGPSGMAYGTEFSPDRLTHRSFRYYVWCTIQVTPRQTEEWRGKLDTYLNNEGYATDSPLTARWDFIKGFSPGVRGWSGAGAKRLCKSAGCWYSSDGRWVEWSQKNPDAAKRLWPTYVIWLRTREYDKAANLLFVIDADRAVTADAVELAIKEVEQMP